jgi:DNA-binding beta-propeller fold protein YncE
VNIGSSAHPSDEHHRQSSGATSGANAKSKAVLMASRRVHFHPGFRPGTRSLRAPRSAVLALGLAGGLLAGCTASSDEVRPPADAFFFPTGIAIDPTEKTLFVANANSELRYDSGTVTALNLDEIDKVVNAWNPPIKDPPDPGGPAKPVVTDGCRADLVYPETLVCDESKFIIGAARIGNFATSLAVQDKLDGNSRLIIPVRGDPSITWVDWNGSQLSCETGGGRYSQCDDEHRLTNIQNSDVLGPIPEEPFRVAVDSGKQIALVTHLTSGTVTLVSTPRDGAPIVADVLGGLFLAGTQSSVPGGSGIAPRKPSAAGSAGTDAREQLMYVASRTEDRVQMLTVEQPADALPYLVQSNYFFLNAVGGNIGGSNDSRGLAFANDGDSMLVINRRPPSLQIYDTSFDETGLPRNQAKSVYDICREASGLVVGNAGGGELALVTCFRDGTMYVIDAAGRRTTDAIVTVGRGPFEVTVSTTRKKAYVTNFLEDTVGVIDLAPGSTRQYREVLRIGESKL